MNGQGYPVDTHGKVGRIVAACPAGDLGRAGPVHSPLDQQRRPSRRDASRRPGAAKVL